MDFRLNAGIGVVFRASDARKCSLCKEFGEEINREIQVLEPRSDEKRSLNSTKLEVP